MTLPVFPEEDDCILPGGHRFAAKAGVELCLPRSSKGRPWWTRSPLTLTSLPLPREPDVQLSEKLSFRSERSFIVIEVGKETIPWPQILARCT